MDLDLLMPSLESINLVKIALRLWNQFEDIKKIIKAGYKFDIHSEFIYNNEPWLNVEKKVIKKAEMLPLPLKVIKKIIPFIKSIGLELMKWIIYHLRCIHEWQIIKYFNYLHWTQLGKIDRRRTAEILVRDDSIGVFERYTLAKVYCFQYDVPILWHKIPSNQHCKYIPDEVGKHLVAFWNDNIEIKDFSNNILHQRAFENAAAAGNKAATEYFFQKLSSEEKKESLLRSAQEVADYFSCYIDDDDFIDYDFAVCGTEKEWVDVFGFLLLQMDEHQRMLILQRNAFRVLVFLLHRPWQDVFIETVQNAWSYLCEYEFGILLNTIIAWVKRDFEYYDYRNLFTRFWKQSPERFKKYIRANIKSHRVLPELFEIKDVENIELILKEMTSIDKKELFLSDVGVSICSVLTKNNDWCSLEFFMQKCVSSEISISGKTFFGDCRTT